VVVLVIICILAVMIFESYQSFVARAGRVQCASNLRSLHVALAAYTLDQNHWPQNPYEIGDPQFDTWWMREMSRYSLGRSNWECPTFKRMQQEGVAEKDKDDKKMIHYIPTPFDDGPRTPYKWSAQPWAVEVGDFHGDGNLILFPDGSIKGFNQYIGGQR
jgi:type II secretory pathway pseudopilin PulG